jgi:probable HAF family extracellular repeat protein
MRHFVLAGLVLILLTTNTSAVSFQSLEDWFGESVPAWGISLSDDGSTVAGQCFIEGNKAVKWDLSSGLTDLGTSAGDSSCVCLSSDGSIIGGNESAGPFRWENGTLTILPPLVSGESCSIEACSADGSVFAGRSGLSACLWENDIPVGLGCLSGYYRSRSISISSDGTTVVGHCEESISSPISEAFRWKDGQIEALGFLPDHVRSYAYAVSGDGEIVIGTSSDMSVSEAYRWVDGEMTGLGYPEGFDSSLAYDISDNGSIVVGRVGYLETTEYSTQTIWSAGIWDSIHGMRDLKQAIEDDFALDLTDWKLEEALWISGDGTLILGKGTGPEGTDYWIAEIPEPATFLLLGLGGATIVRRKMNYHRRR